MVFLISKILIMGNLDIVGVACPIWLAKSWFCHKMASKFWENFLFGAPLVYVWDHKICPQEK